jgi:hypothetical protein
MIVMTLCIGISPQKTSKHVVTLQDGKIFFSHEEKTIKNENEVSICT